jgi:hypothetical protein
VVRTLPLGMGCWPCAHLAAVVVNTQLRMRAEHVPAYVWLGVSGCPRACVQVQDIKCSLREILFWKRCVESNASMLAPYSAAFKAKLLGELDPGMWELSVLMPPRAPPSESKQARKELRAARCCRYGPSFTPG